MTNMPHNAAFIRHWVYNPGASSWVLLTTTLSPIVQLNDPFPRPVFDLCVSGQIAAGILFRQSTQVPLSLPPATPGGLERWSGGGGHLGRLLRGLKHNTHKHITMHFSILPKPVVTIRGLIFPWHFDTRHIVYKHKYVYFVKYVNCAKLF